MHIEDAQALATRLLGALGDACERIEVAGSVRRRKAEVKDIELVAIPRWRDEPQYDVTPSLFTGLAEPPVHRVNLLAEAVRQFDESDAIRIIKPGAAADDLGRWHIDDGGRYWRLYVPARRVKLDLFLASPETWGPVFLYRTGSAEFSAAMLARWKQVSGGGYSRDGQLYRPAHREPERLLEERDVFAACEVAYVPPEERLDAAAVYRAAHAGSLREALANEASARLSEAHR